MVKLGTAALVAAGLLLTQGCSQPEPKAPESKSESTVSSEPVTLTFFIQAGTANFTDKEFQDFVAGPVAKKFPNITVQFIPKGQGNALNDLASAGRIPDIIYGSPGDLTAMNNLNLFTDLSGLIKSQSFDLARLEPDVMDNARAYSKKNEIAFMPHSVNGGALYYNKDLFDKFGVAYPKDGLTWDNLLELARKVSRIENGIEYRGFGMDTSFLMQNSQLSLPFVDPATNKSLANTSGWTSWFNTMKRFFEIPGNMVTDTTKLDNSLFLKDRTTAMWAASNILNLLQDASATGMNWDMATLPSFAEAPGTGIQLNAPFYSISPSSQLKEQAFQVISVLLSDEVQLIHTKLGRMTVLKNADIRKQFAADMAFTKGKNMNAMFSSKVAKPRVPHAYDGPARTAIAAKFSDVIKGKTDVNTALREAEEQGNKSIQELLNAK